MFLFGLIMVLPFGYQELTQVELYQFTSYDLFAVAFVIIGATSLAVLLPGWLLGSTQHKTISSTVFGLHENNLQP